MLQSFRQKGTAEGVGKDWHSIGLVCLCHGQQGEDSRLRVRKRSMGIFLGRERKREQLIPCFASATIPIPRLHLPSHSHCNPSTLRLLCLAL